MAKISDILSKDFDNIELIGQGAYGLVYKGKIK